MTVFYNYKREIYKNYAFSSFLDKLHSFTVLNIIQSAKGLLIINITDDRSVLSLYFLELQIFFFHLHLHLLNIITTKSIDKYIYNSFF